MDKKDLAIGILLIAIVGLSGGLGFMFIAGPDMFGPPPEDPTNLFGLPDDWNTAPNSSFFMLYNQTGASIKVTLKDILDGVALAVEEAAAGGPGINEYKDIIYPYTFVDPSSGLYVTGVDLLDILEKYDTNFGWDLTINSDSGYTLDLTTGDIITNMYENENPYIVAIAANKEWLAESPLGSSWGNFTFLGKEYPSVIYDMNTVEVRSNWTVEVIVNGSVEYIIDQNNMKLNQYDDIYSYDRDDWWTYNRHYWGRNISEIISHTDAGVLNYTVRFWSTDGWATPWPFGGEKKEPRYNNTHIETGIVSPYPRWADGYLNDTADLINITQVPLPETDLLMALVYADQEFGESGQGITDPIWPYRTMCGYHRGPFYVAIPGRPRETYLKYVTRIEITSYSGPIPSGFEL